MSECSASFFTPIIMNQNSLWSVAESYLDVGQQTVYREIASNDKIFLCEQIEAKRNVSMLSTIWRVVSYATIILPLIMLGIRLYCRLSTDLMVVPPESQKINIQKTPANGADTTDALVTIHPRSIEKILPKELIAHSMKWLGYGELHCLAQTSKSMYRLASLHHVWQSHAQEFGKLGLWAGEGRKASFTINLKPNDPLKDIVRFCRIVHCQSLFGLEESQRFIFILRSLDDRSCVIRASVLESWCSMYWKVPAHSLMLNKRNIGRVHPIVFSAFKNLASLYLVDCKIYSLPKTINQMTSVTTLSLRENILEELPDELGDMNTLTELSVSKNLLKRLPETIGNMTGLEILDIEGNCFTGKLPKSMVNLTRLRSLRISRRHIPLLPDAMQGKPYIRVVDDAQ